MTDILLQIGATKLAIAIALAGTVWVVQQRVDRPATVHALWLMVLGAMLVPAVVPLRVLPKEVVERVVVQSEVMAQPEVVPLRLPPEELAVEVVAEFEAGSSAGVADDGVSGDGMAPKGWLAQHGKPLAALLWLIGSAGFFAWTVLRTVRFQRMLTRAARPAPQLQRLAAEIGDTLGLQRVPGVYTTGARLRPLVWWAGGRVRILIPSVFLAELDETELRAVLAHELAHVRRRDYLVRGVELLACSAYWWNPVVWWVKRRMRSSEESSCDILAVSASRLTRDRYARSLLRVVEVMSVVPIPRAPALASTADSCLDSRRLEKRLRTVLATPPVSPRPRRLHMTSAAALMCGLSLGLVYCTPGERRTFDQLRLPTPVMSKDSAGIRIVEYAGAPDQKAPFGLAPDPRYRHGNNPGDYRVRYIYAGALLPGGRAVVSDAINNELIVLSQDGATHELLAGKGKRPGDVSAFIAVAALGQDSVLVADQRQSRVTLFARGSVARTVETRSADGLWMRGIGSSGHLLMSTAGFISGFEEEWLPGHLARLDLRTGIVDTVASYDFMPYSPPGKRWNPFLGFGDVTVAGRQFVYTRSDRPEITWRLPDGTIRQIVRWRPERSYATEDHLRLHRHLLWQDHYAADPGASVASLEEREKEDMAATNVRLGFPLPLFRFPVGDSEGRVWLPTNVTGGPREGSPPFTVISPDGEWLGTVEAPVGFHILDATEGLVLGVQRDETWQESVVVYDLLER